MKILIGYEASGKVRDAFRKLGHDVYSCDIRPAEDGSPYHIQGNVFDHLDDGWNMFIFHPPCTYLCVSGMHWTRRGLRDPQLTEDAVAEVQRLMQRPEPWAIENPVGILSTRIRKPDQIIQPYEFGHDASKKTCLWLNRLPKLRSTYYVEPRIVDGRKRWSNQTDSGQNRLGPSEVVGKSGRGPIPESQARWQNSGALSNP